VDTRQPRPLAAPPRGEKRPPLVFAVALALAHQPPAWAPPRREAFVPASATLPAPFSP
jgi:hypothetical protein